MGAMTALDFVSELREMLGELDVGKYPDSRLLDWVNKAAALDVATLYEIPSLQFVATITLVPNQMAYDMPVGCIRIHRDPYLAGSSDKLREVLREDYYQYGGDGQVAGDPQFWLEESAGTNDRRRISVFPKPRAAKSMYVPYTKRPRELVLIPTANQLDLSELWDDPVLYYAAKRGATILREFPEAEAHGNLAEEFSKKALKLEFRASTTLSAISPPHAPGR